MLKVSEGVYRGPHLAQKDFPAQCRHSLDLESGSRLFGDNSPLEEAMSLELIGVRTWAHPMGAIFPPTLDEIEIGVELMQCCSHEGIYVHCKKGVDRTGIFCAGHRVLVDGWSPWDAAIECFREGMHWIYLPWLIQLWRL